ncbi:hypothetical protein OG369_24510 [Streptomyces sp. NBC_01221]|uniref:hypothetical protein n=1 Tax=unclassified Streptomyces TaxID=2593676 RepID=UPI00224C9267|nr:MULTISPECIES: hypothetical protein [unclassified Streptomyces]MCX4789230.1 hypothetical protein [Streptomyces sp. NBC_01221]WSJ36333.1 hypothetical protein OG772_10035 [Streptomyces sp. NBC_01321]WSU21876.1 hypothetical protein OG508_13490 [Streptomyces sp. NBC_01108]
MTTNTSSQRGALVVVFVGIALTLTGSVLVFLTHEPTWRYLLAGGGFVQFVGWVLHNRARRGGAA